MRALLAAALTLIAIAPAAPAWTVTPGAGAAGGDDWACDTCQLRGFRDLQGGTAANPNLDIGAGSADNPGTLSLQYDVGDRTNVYAGQRIVRIAVRRDAIVLADDQGAPLVQLGPGRRIVFYAEPIVRPR